MLLYLIVILWGVEQIVLQRLFQAARSDYALRSLGIIFVAGVVCVSIAVSPPAIGSVVTGVLALHGVVTMPLLFVARERGALRRARAALSRTPRKPMPFL